MILKRLEMQGFKSFSDKTTITFDDGITAIVGPNGSGKSNISDAMRWVLGEVSSKNLRGSKMEDVIFNGSSTRKPSSYAQVSIIFDNQGATLDMPYDEVSLTRRYSRSGDSDYYINQKSVRLRDIHELLMNTGVGREGYSIIGQGKISEILSTRSDERRGIFEEASGIAKFRYKKDESEKKLAAVEDNLIRINDILSEITARVEPLSAEADKAHRYLELYERRKELEIAIWLDKLDEIRAGIERNELDFELVKNNLFVCENDINSSEEKVEQIYAKTQGLILQIEECREKSNELNQLSSALHTKNGVLQNDITHLKAAKAQNNADIQLTNDEYEKIEDDIRTKTTAIDEIYRKYTAALVESADFEGIYDKLGEQLSQLNGMLSSQNSSKNDLYADVNSLNLALTEQNTREQGYEQRRIVLDRQIVVSKERLKSLEDELTVSTEALMAINDEIARVRANHRDIKSQADDASQIIAQTKESAEKLRLQISEIAHRAETIERMDRLFEGYNTSVKAILQAGERGGLKGIRGSISQLITSPGEFSLAIETALGGAVQNIVVETEENARAAIDFLKKSAQGRATFYPLSVIKGNTINERDMAQCEGFVGIASQLVSYSPEYKNIVENQLGRTVVADNLSSATAIARKYSYRYRVVTRDGQIINSGGSYTGGSSGVRSGLLTRKSDVQKLNTNREELQLKLDELNAQFATQTEKLQELTRKQSALSGDFAELDSKRMELSTSIKLCELNKNNESLTLEKGQNEYTAIKRERENYALSLAEIDEQIASRKREIELTESGISEMVSQIDEITAKREAINQKINLHKLLLQQILNEQAIENERLINLQTMYQRIKNENSGRMSANADIDAQVEQIERKIEQNEREIAYLDGEYSSVNKKINEYEFEQRGFEKKSIDLYALIKEKTASKEVLLRDYNKLEMKKQDLTNEHDQIIGRMWDEYELNYSSASQIKVAIPPEMKNQAGKELNVLRDGIKKLGNVNVNAIDEYIAIKERFDFLSEQVSDLETSKEQLHAIIAQLEEQMRVEFASSIEVINANFREVFVELFEGGNAEVVLTDVDNILESGIDIKVQPPGKIIKNLMALSGGEQAFVAIALYLAILKMNPTPFCILDEIDTALDEMNVERLAAYIQHHCSATQYVLITHRRGTMEVANRLYGITMSEPGVSRFLTININEVEKRTGASVH